MPTLRQPSATMQAVCAARVDHHIADPIADVILSQLPEARAFRDELDQLSRGMFTRTIVMRSAVFAKALRDYEGVCSQLVILCSGLDFRYLNYAGWRTSPCFLIDHPDSLMLTTELTQDHASELALTQMVPVDLVDFSSESLAEQLALLGFNRRLPTLFLWEGATYYFQPDVVYKILNVTRSLCDNSTVVVDFANEGSFMQKQKQLEPLPPVDEECRGVDKTMALLKKKHEPWYGFFNATSVHRHLSAIGFGAVDIQWDSAVEKSVFGDQQMVPESMFYVRASHS